MKTKLLIMSFVMLISGCVVHPPSVEIPEISIEPPIKIITPDSGHSNPKGCPPGLRKQGRC